MSRSLAKDIRRLNQIGSHEGTQEQYQSCQSEILRQLALLDVPDEIFELMITHNALKSLIAHDIRRTAIIWKHHRVEEFLDEAWANGDPSKSRSHFVRGRCRHYALKSAHYFQTCVARPRLLWASQVLFNIAYFVLLTIFIHHRTLLSVYPHPMDIALSAVFFIPSLFPPYTPTFLGYLTIDILYLISFIFRDIAFKNWPSLTFDSVQFLLNARTLLSFLPLVQIFNVVLLIFPLPSFNFLGRLLRPILPIAILMFTGFFLTLHYLTDTHRSVQNTFDILLRTVLLNINPEEATQFHPVAGRIAYYLFAFLSIYFFWGVGIAGVGMRVVNETDWHAERVRWKAIRLLRYLPDRHKHVRRKRLFGRGKVLSPLPFNVVEGIGVALRLRWLSALPLYLSMIPVVLGWSLGLLCVNICRWVWPWLRRAKNVIVDEVEDEDETGMDIESEEDGNESRRLLS